MSIYGGLAPHESQSTYAGLSPQSLLIEQTTWIVSLS
jgi:hypothetical protein